MYTLPFGDGMSGTVYVLVIIGFVVIISFIVYGLVRGAAQRKRSK